MLLTIALTVCSSIAVAEVTAGPVTVVKLEYAPAPTPAPAAATAPSSEYPAPGLPSRDEEFRLTRLLVSFDDAVRESAAYSLLLMAASYEQHHMYYRAGDLYTLLITQPGTGAAAEAASARLRTLQAAEPKVGADPVQATEEVWKELFDGKTFDGWNGEMDWFRIEEGAIVAGKLSQDIPENYFLCTNDRFDHFELELEVKLVGKATNAGVQFRSERVPGSSEVSGYQADLGQQYWGALYDEARRNRILAAPEPGAALDAARPDEWNHYRIVCRGARIQLWLNGVQTVDYTEKEPGIAQSGVIGLQIHSGPPAEAWYRNIRIRPATP